MTTAPLSAVLFDLDGTLYRRVDCLPVFLAAQYDRRRDLLGAVSRDTFIAKFVAHDANGSVRRDEAYPRVLSDIGADPGAAATLVADYISTYRDFCRPSPDCFPTLERLRTAGYRLGLVTNGQTPIQENTIAGLGLSESFDVIVISENEGIRKPDPEIFRRALARLDVTADAAVYVGDNPHADIDGARAAAMGAIWIVNDVYDPPHNAHATVRSLAEVPALVADW
jgi:putative hydrolase of the HAD superfamily